MDFYEKLINDIENLIEEEKDERAIALINEELSMPYVPRDIEEKLHMLLDKISNQGNDVNYVSDEKLIKLLDGDKNQQLIGVDTLDKRNLRDYLDIVEKFLMEDKFVNAKVLLIDSLVKQEINCDLQVLKEGEVISFNPSKLKSIDKTEEYKLGIRILDDKYMKEPSKMYLAVKVLNESAIMKYPSSFTSEEIRVLTSEIIRYIDEAFDSAN